MKLETLKSQIRKFPFYFSIGRNDAYVLSFGIIRRKTQTWLFSMIFATSGTYGHAELGIGSAVSNLTPSGRFVANKVHWFKLPFNSFFRRWHHNRFQRLFPK